MSYSKYMLKILFYFLLVSSADILPMQPISYYENRHPKAKKLYGLEAALIENAKENNCDLMLKILNLGININVCNEHGRTPLIIGAINNNLELVRMLIYRGANTSITDVYGKSAYNYAIDNENYEIFEVLRLKSFEIYNSNCLKSLVSNLNNPSTDELLDQNLYRSFDYYQNEPKGDQLSLEIINQNHVAYVKSNCNAKNYKWHCYTGLNRNKIRNHKCDFKGCTKSYVHIKSLKAHQKLHTGIGLHICNYSGCGRAFISLLNLKNHQLSHDKK